jgi:hypothetical protein
MTTVIQTKNGTGVPDDQELFIAELAIDLASRTLYTSTDGIDIVRVGAAGNAGDVVPGTVDGTTLKWRFAQDVDEVDEWVENTNIQHPASLGGTSPWLGYIDETTPTNNVGMTVFGFGSVCSLIASNDATANVPDKDLTVQANIIRLDSKFAGTQQGIILNVPDHLEHVAVWGSGTVSIGPNADATATLRLEGVPGQANTFNFQAPSDVTTNTILRFDNADEGLKSPAILNKASTGGSTVKVGTGGLLYSENATAFSAGVPITDALVDLDTLVPKVLAGDFGFDPAAVDSAGYTSFVGYDDASQPKSIQYEKLVPLLVKGIQELHARVIALETP